MDWKHKPQLGAMTGEPRYYCTCGFVATDIRYLAAHMEVAPNGTPPATRTMRLLGRG